MKVLFIESPLIGWLNPLFAYLPNPGVLDIAAYIEKVGHSVEILDMPALGLEFKDLTKIINQKKPDVVGISSIVKNAYVGMAIAEVVKSANPRIVTVAGGSHFTLVPELSLKICKDIDYIVIGEGEVTFAELLNELNFANGKKENMRKIKGLAFVDNGKYIETEPRPLIKDLDLLPFPAFHLIPIEKYYLPLLGKKGLSVSFSRGCTFKCDFCSERYLWRSTWRGKSARRMIEELELLYKRYGCDGFWFNDDNFLLNRRRNIDFINEMEKIKLPIKFHLQTRIDHFLNNEDIIPRLRNIGATVVMVGVDSFSQETVDSWNKSQSLTDAKRVGEVLKKSRIPIYMACFILGNYSENKESFKKATRFAEEIKATFFSNTLIAPWPGTDFFEEMKKKDMIKVWDWRKYDFDHAIMETKNLSLIELERLYILSVLIWVFHPIRIIRNVLQPDKRRYQFIYFCMFFKFIFYFIKNIFHNKRTYYSKKIDEIYKRHLAFIGKDDFIYTGSTGILHNFLFKS